MLTLGIDKLALVYPNMAPDHYSTIIHFIVFMKGEGAKVWKSKYSTQCAVKLSDQRTLLLQVGITHGKLYAKFEFNGQLQPNEWDTLKTRLITLFDYGSFTLYHNANVHYLELAADIKNISMNNYFFYHPTLRSTNYAYEAKGTLYIGSERTRCHFTIYDKAKEQMDKKGVDVGYPWTRVEARFSRLPMTIPQFVATD